MNSIYEGHFAKVKKAFLLHHHDESKRPSWFYPLKNDILFVTMDVHVMSFLTKDFVKVYTRLAVNKSEFLEIIDI